MALVKMPTVEEELKRNLKLTKTDLDMVKDWLKKQPHLPSMSDFELVLFLHSNYYRIEPTKTTIDTYFTVRTHVPEFFSKCDPIGSKELRDTMKVVSYIPLPGTTPNGYKVIYTKIIDSDPSRFVFSDVVKLLCMTTELWLYGSGTIPGHVMLLDMEGVLFGHLARLNPMEIKKYFHYLQEGLPVRLKGYHFMNTVPFMDLIVNMMKPFLKKDLMDVFALHSGQETLSKFVPIDLLPNEQGGKAGPLKDLWAEEVKKIEEHSAWFKEQEIRKVNEAARPNGKTKNARELFGVEGSFKKLDID